MPIVCEWSHTSTPGLSDADRGRATTSGRPSRRCARCEGGEWTDAVHDPTTLVPVPRRLPAVLALALALAVVAGVAAPAAAQVPGLTATLTVVPTSTGPSGTAQATAVFQPPTTPGPVQVTIDLNGLVSGTASLALGTTTSELKGCVLRLNSTRVRCDWLTGSGGPQTLTVTINVAASAAPQFGSVQALGSASGTPLVVLDFTNFAITQQAPPTTAATTTTTTTAPTGPTTSAAVAPTSAAATTAAALPPTGGSNANAFIALTALALGAFLLIVARKVRET